MQQPPPPFSPHNCFFSSLHHLEQRLSSEKPNLNLNLNLNENTDNALPLSSPLCLLTNPSSSSSSTINSSLPPCEFITSFSPIPTNANSPQQHPLPLAHNNNNANVEELMSLLGLSVPTKHDGTTCSYSSCGDGFYREVVGVKGLRYRKEMERLDEWVNVFFKEKRETVRLVHLMIGKAVAVSHAAESSGGGGGGGRGFEGMEFPATIEEFLERDPPLMTEMEGGE